MNKATWLKLAMNIWPPYLGAGIRVEHISPDFRDVVVALHLRWYNRNYVGTHFGGSLAAMTDPFYMLMLIENLGPEYVVWDKAAAIEFVRPGRGTVRAHFHLDPEQIEQVRAAAADGKAHFPEFDVDVLDAAGQVVARVHKTLYVRWRATPSR